MQLPQWATGAQQTINKVPFAGQLTGKPQQKVARRRSLARVLNLKLDTPLYDVTDHPDLAQIDSRNSYPLDDMTMCEMQGILSMPRPMTPADCGPLRVLATLPESCL